MDQFDKKQKIRSKEYPSVSIEEAIRFLERFRDYPIGKPISYRVASNLIGVKPSTRSFSSKLSSARQYGLLKTSSGDVFTILDDGRRLIRPTETPLELNKLKFQCFLRPKLYSELLQAYVNSSIPNETIFPSILIEHYGIAPAVAENAANVFVSNAEYVGALVNGVLVNEFSGNKSISGSDENPADNSEDESNGESMFSENDLSSKIDNSFAAPLIIPFGDSRKAILYLPINASKEDAEYILAMINLMFKNVYKIG